MPGPQKISASPALGPKPSLERDDSSTLTPVPEISERGIKDLPSDPVNDQVGAATRPEIRTGRPGFNAGMENLERILAELLKLNGK